METSDTDKPKDTPNTSTPRNMMPSWEELRAMPLHPIKDTRPRLVFFPRIGRPIPNTTPAPEETPERASPSPVQEEEDIAERVRRLEQEQRRQGN